MHLIKFAWSTQEHHRKYMRWYGWKCWHYNYEKYSWKAHVKIWSETNTLKEYEKSLNVKMDTRVPTWLEGNTDKNRKYVGIEKVWM